MEKGSYTPVVWQVQVQGSEGIVFVTMGHSKQELDNYNKGNEGKKRRKRGREKHKKRGREESNFRGRKYEFSQ